MIKTIEKNILFKIEEFIKKRAEISPGDIKTYLENRLKNIEA